MNGKDFLSISDLSPGDIQRLISTAVELKAEGWSSMLSEKTLVLMFEKPSTRTRVSFDVGMRQLGGHCLYLSPEEVGLGKRADEKIGGFSGGMRQRVAVARTLLRLPSV